MEKEDSKDCITYYNRISQNLLANGSYANLLGIKLITGRKHQIRCHLHGYLDNPILNDRRYGGFMIKDNT
jgi:23S rRNA-/tRNA-specific pseudouridylate synthase